MPWSSFGPHEHSAPSARLTSLEGEAVEIADFRGRANLVVVFVDSVSRAGYRRLIQQFAARRSELQALDAETLIIVPPDTDPLQSDSAGLYLLVDSQDDLRRRYADLTEQDTDSRELLFVLDRFGAPYAAWMGELADETGLVDEAFEWLEFVELQCPECGVSEWPVEA